jgi:predicted enzyme related to lactoylglutathione lyase
MNLNSILIGSEDPQRLWDYYTGLLGKPAMDDGGYKGWQIGSGFISVGAHSEVKGKNAHPGRIILNIESSDVNGDFEKLKSAGAIVIQEPYQPAEGYWIATLSDPDGNYFQLVSPVGAM